MVKVGDDNRGGGEEREVVGTERSRGETRGMKVVKVVVRTPARGFGGGSSGGSAIDVVVGVGGRRGGGECVGFYRWWMV